MKPSMPPLNEAPAHVQLAVDLIHLLETNEIEPELALKAIQIVEQDLQRKIESFSNLHQ